MVGRRARTRAPWWRAAPGARLRGRIRTRRRRRARERAPWWRFAPVARLALHAPQRQRAGSVVQAPTAPSRRTSGLPNPSRLDREDREMFGPRTVWTANRTKQREERESASLRRRSRLPNCPRSLAVRGMQRHAPSDVATVEFGGRGGASPSRWGLLGGWRQPPDAGVRGGSARARSPKQEGARGASARLYATAQQR